jgi:hypothetical protein
MAAGLWSFGGDGTVRCRAQDRYHSKGVVITVKSTFIQAETEGQDEDTH